jgi:ABC-type lipoprotein release transport system permease subunit
VAQVIGIDPQSEDNMTGLKNKLINGAYLIGNSEGLLVAEGLAQMLKISVGDSIILYGQGYHGQIAAARLPVAGLVKLPFEEMNNRLVYMTLGNAQNVFSSYDRITSLSIMIDNIKHLDVVLSAVRAVVGQKFAIMTWDKMMPDLVQSIQIDNASGIIMLAILYIIIGFGIFGTVMMMVSERAKEFGILISVGMKKWKLIFVAALETIFISFLGVITGIIGSLPLVSYLYHNPIPITGDAAKTFESLGIEAVFTFSADPVVFTNQAMVVFIIALATIVYPFLFIRKLEPVNVLRG